MEDLQEIKSIDELNDEDTQILKEAILLRLDKIEKEKDNLKKYIEERSKLLKEAEYTLNKINREEELKKKTQEERKRMKCEKLNRIIPFSLNIYRKCIIDYMNSQTTTPIMEYNVFQERVNTYKTVIGESTKKIKELEDEDLELRLFLVN